MSLIKVIGNEKISIKIILAHAETAETTKIMLRTVSKHKMALIKVIGNENTSLKIISAKTETIENKLRTGSKYEMALIKVIHIKLLLHPYGVLRLFSA